MNVDLSKSLTWLRKISSTVKSRVTLDSNAITLFHDYCTDLKPFKNYVRNLPLAIGLVCRGFTDCLPEMGVGSMVALRLVCLTLELAAGFRGLDGDIVLCSRVRHLTLISLSPPTCKGVLANLTAWG